MAYLVPVLPLDDYRRGVRTGMVNSRYWLNLCFLIFMGCGRKSMELQGLCSLNSVPLLHQLGPTCLLSCSFQGSQLSEINDYFSFLVACIQHLPAGKVSHGESTKSDISFWGRTKVLSSISMLSKVSLLKRTGSKRSVQILGINPGPAANDITDCLNHTTVTHIQRA